MPARVLIDTDPAIGIPARDVDDALAIMYLLALEDAFEVAGITPVHGNASLAKTARAAHDVLRVAGRQDVPVRPGAAGKRDLGKPSPASRLLIETVLTLPGEVTVLAIGPLTNVATAMILDPEFASRVGRLVVMGGSLDAGMGIPLLSPLEFNFLADTRAAEAVLAARCEKVVITSDLYQQVVFGRRELEALQEMGSYQASWLARRIEPWLRLNNVAPLLPWRGGFVPWDVIAAVYLQRPDLFEEEETCLRLRPARPMTGAIERCEGDAPCRLPVQVRSDELLDEFLDAIAQFEP